MLGLLAAVVLSSGGPKLASPEWTLVNLSPELGRFYAEHLAQALRQEGVEVATAQDFATLLGVERQKQLLGCDQGTSCVTELANALGCDGTITVTLAQLKDGLRGVAKVLSGRDGAVLASVTLEGRDDSALLSALTRAAPILAEPFRKAGKASGQRWWLVPGGVGVLGLGGGVALYVLAAAQLGFIKAGAMSWSEADAARTLGRTFETWAWVSGGVGVAGLVASVVMLALAPHDQVALVPTGNGFALAGRW